MRWAAIKTTVLSALVLSTACVEQLPPARTPDRVIPAVDVNAPVADGHGRLVIDVVDGPTMVHRVDMRAQLLDNGEGRQTWQFSESSSVLCPASPCVVDVATGNLLLGFPVRGDLSAMEVELVHVGTEASVYRRALSYSDPPSGMFVTSVVGASLGGVTMVPGLVFLPLGLAKDRDGFTVAGAITLGVGSVLLAVSILGIVAGAPSYQAGSSIHFPLANDSTSGGE